MDLKASTDPASLMSGSAVPLKILVCMRYVSRLVNWLSSHFTVPTCWLCVLMFFLYKMTHKIFANCYFSVLCCVGLTDCRNAGEMGGKVAILLIFHLFNIITTMLTYATHTHACKMYEPRKETTT